MSTPNRGKIFVSYRREGGQELARLILDHLSFRGYDVFLDTESMGGGTFNTKLLQRIRESSDFILILTPGALDRCVNKSDWVRQELACALANNINIVPVFARGFTFESVGPLSPDIEKVRFYNGATVNHEYFTAFVDKLEDYLTAEPLEDPYVSIDKKKPINPAQKRRRKSRILGAVAALLLLCIILLPLLLNRGGGLPPVSETQTFGSSTGNLCNDGLASSNGAASGGSKTISYIHSLDDWKYWYSSSKRAICSALGEEDSIEILSNVDVGYLSVSTDWFYYTLEGAETVLYRARRLEDGAVMGEAEELASGISGSSDIIVDGDHAYYWRSGEGLCKLSLEKRSKESILYPTESIWELQMLGKNADYIYGCDQDSLWRISTLSGEKETVFLVKDQLADRTISGGNVQGDWIYFITADRGENAFSHADRLYRIHIDGSALEHLFIAEHAEQSLISVCTYDNYKLLLTGEQNGNRIAFRLNSETKNISERTTPNGLTMTETLGVTVGNSLTNLCSTALLTENEQGDTIYLSSSNSRFYNRLANGDLIYFCKDNTIYCQWKNSQSEFEKLSLLENVTCSYLYVTPDWFYCVLEENGVATLYRAENDPAQHTIGALEVLAENIAAENSVAIKNGWIYYWVKDEGLYQMSVSTKNPTLIYTLDGSNTICSGWHTFNVTDNELHFFAGNGLYRVSIEDGKLYFLLDGSELYSNGKVISAVADDTAVYYGVKYLDENGNRTKADEIWRMDYADKQAKLLCTMASTEDAITSLNLTSRYGYIRLDRNGTAELHRFSFADGSLTLTDTY